MPCRLETLNEARQGQVNRVKIAEKEREGLEGEKLAAEAYLFKDAERLGAQSKIFQRFMHDGQVQHTIIALRLACAEALALLLWLCAGVWWVKACLVMMQLLTQALPVTSMSAEHGSKLLCDMI